MREIKLALSSEDFETLVRGGEIINSVESYVRTGGRLVPGGSERIEAHMILSDIGFSKMQEVIRDAAAEWAKSDKRQGQVALVEAIPEANAQITVTSHAQRIKDLDERTDRCQSKLIEIGEILTRIEKQLRR